MANIEKVLHEIYYDSKSPGSFGGKQALYNEARKKLPNLKIKDVIDWLSGQLTYSLHKQTNKRFKRNKIIATKPKENLQADLVDMKHFANQNDGYQYILTVIDVFSKIAFARALKDKSSKTVSEAMKEIVQNYCPFKLMTDEGREFTGNNFVSLMKDFNIKHHYARNKTIKCSIVERFNKTLKNKMFRYFTLKGNRRYIDVLPSLIESYNNSYHRSIKMTPKQVGENNIQEVFYNLYGYHSLRDYLRKMTSPKLSIEDKVRTKYELKSHDRGYYPLWSDDIYSVYKSVPGKVKPYYHLKSESGQVLPRRYYPNEIQKVKPNLYRIEKILRQKTVRGKKQYLVKWLNHSEAHNSWIPAEDITKING